ncbi:MAG: hypothetical protein MI742_10795, partial [Desulfobacterales bacterium]|nr:hypothetical protein [Desulfobacterales bacterium]
MRDPAMNDGPSTQPPHFQEQRFLYFAVLISLVGHILLFGISHLLSQSSLKNTKHHKAIDIDLVQTNLTPEPAKPKKKQESPKNASKTASKSKPNTAPAKKTTKKKNRSTQKSLSGNPVVKRKRRVITPEELVQNALKQIQQHEATKPQPKDRLSDRLKKMRQEIKNSEARETQTGSDAVTAKGKKSAGQISILERYHQSVRVIIRSNWAFPPR